MAVSLEQEHSGSKAERQQLGVDTATLHAVRALAVGVQSQQVVQRTCLLLGMVHMGSGRQLEVQMGAKSSEEDLEEDPWEEVEVSIVLLARTGPEADLRGAVAGSGMGKLQCSWEYRDAKLA
jgi:hypothetical protein